MYVYALTKLSRQARHSGSLLKGTLYMHAWMQYIQLCVCACVHVYALTEFPRQTCRSGSLREGIFL